ncbi:MAG: glycosyltransferase family 2 protein [Clostridia bacterium]|nr:glycosyltransferase family 2 protein [Clostridia bacterium]
MDDERNGGIMEAKAFSVIMPVYNVAPYLTKALDTLLPQCGDDVQVIAVDDGSTDGSGGILDQYAGRYPQMEVIHQKNGGVARARNEGLARARGEYILWVDPDDWVSADYLTIIRREIREKHPDMLIFDYAHWNGAAREEKRYARTPGKQEIGRVLMDLSRDWRLTSVLWNKAIHRRFFEGAHFDEQLRCLEDYALIYPIMMCMAHIEYVPEVLYAYRIREDGLVRAPDLEVGYESFCQAMKRYDTMQKKGAPHHVMGTLLQAKGYLCKYYICGMPQERTARERYRLCRRHLIRHAGLVLADRELPGKEKLKYLLIVLPFVGRIYGAKKRRATGRSC